jgi:hypothetical protein
LFSAQGFGPLEEKEFANPHAGDVEQVVVARSLSVSFVAALPTEERQRVSRKIRALIGDTPAFSEGRVAFPYLTRIYTCRKESKKHS